MKHTVVRLSYSVHEIQPYINWIYFYYAWSMNGKPDEAKQKLRHDAEDMLALGVLEDHPLGVAGHEGDVPAVCVQPRSCAHRTGQGGEHDAEGHFTTVVVGAESGVWGGVGGGWGRLRCNRRAVLVRSADRGVCGRNIRGRGMRGREM